MKVSEQIAQLKPYQPGKPISETQRELGLDRVVKLASNENPLGPSPAVTAALQKALAETHRYPDASCFGPRQALADYYGIAPNQLAFGNGSNELIDLLIRIYCEPGDCIVTSQAAFIAYKICAQAARVTTHEVALNENLEFDLSALLTEVQQRKPRLVFLPNPNNPTGTYVPEKALVEFLAATENQQLLVVMDEAYCEFVRASDCADGRVFVDRFSHVLSLRTLSKVFGLAGLRFGVLLARPEVIDLVDRVRNPFNVNSLAQVAVEAAVKDVDYIKKAQQLNWEGLDFFYSELQRLGLKYWPSQGNFVLFDSGFDGAEVAQELLKMGLIARPVKAYGLATHIRLSVGLPEENQFAINCLEQYFKEKS